MSFLDKSSEVTPHLVKLYDKHKSYALAAQRTPMARVEMTNSVASILEMNVSPREGEMIADVLIDLVRQAETDLRQAIAERLAGMDGVPLRLILQFTNDDISIASSVLRSSTVLDDLDLIYIVKSQGPEYWQCIASRSKLSDQVINILADTEDIDTAIALAENLNIKLTNHAVVALSDLAQNSDRLALPLLKRDEVEKDIAAKLYQYVGEQIRKFIEDNYDIDTAGLVLSAVDDVVLELSAIEEPTEFTPDDNMKRAADALAAKGDLTPQILISALRRGQMQSFIALFSRFTGLSAAVVEKTLLQPNGQGLAVACRAHDIAKDDFVSIYLLTNTMRNKGKMVDLKDLTKAVNYFNRIKPDVARDIMANSQES